MDEQLVIDSSGAWVRKTAQLIAEKPLPLENFGGSPCAANQSYDYRSIHYDESYTVPPD